MNYFLTLAVALFGSVNFWFIYSCLKKRNDVADVAWGLNFILLAWLSFGLSDTRSIRGLLLGILVTIWGLRLAWHIHARNKHKAEDYRYQAWRKEWGKSFYLRSYLQVYLLQGFFLFLISLPILWTNQSFPSELGFLDLLGVLAWLFGFLFEAISDWQLTKFVNNPSHKGMLMQSGLWQYSRHPNYFGEVTLWWGIWMIALSVPNGWMSVIGPLTITTLIVKVSGIPLLEKKRAGNPEFESYKKRVSKFVPMFKR